MRFNSAKQGRLFATGYRMSWMNLQSACKWLLQYSKPTALMSGCVCTGVAYAHRCGFESKFFGNTRKMEQNLENSGVTA